MHEYSTKYTKNNVLPFFKYSTLIILRNKIFPLSGRKMYLYFKVKKDKIFQLLYLYLNASSHKKSSYAFKYNFKLLGILCVFLEFKNSKILFCKAALFHRSFDNRKKYIKHIYLIYLLPMS